MNQNLNQWLTLKIIDLFQKEYVDEKSKPGYLNMNHWLKDAEISEKKLKLAKELLDQIKKYSKFAGEANYEEYSNKLIAMLEKKQEEIKGVSAEKGLSEGTLDGFCVVAISLLKEFKKIANYITAANLKLIKSKKSIEDFNKTQNNEILPEAQNIKDTYKDAPEPCKEAKIQETCNILSQFKKKPVHAFVTFLVFQYYWLHYDEMRSKAVTSYGDEYSTQYPHINVWNFKNLLLVYFKKLNTKDSNNEFFYHKPSELYTLISSLFAADVRLRKNCNSESPYALIVGSSLTILENNYDFKKELDDILKSNNNKIEEKENISGVKHVNYLMTHGSELNLNQVPLNENVESTQNCNSPILFSQDSNNKKDQIMGQIPQDQLSVDNEALEDNIPDIENYKEDTENPSEALIQEPHGNNKIMNGQKNQTKGLNQQSNQITYAIATESKATLQQQQKVSLKTVLNAGYAKETNKVALRNKLK